MVEMAEVGRVHDVGDGLIRVPIAQLATIHIDPRKTGALAETAIVQVTGEKAGLVGSGGSSCGSSQT